MARENVLKRAARALRLSLYHWLNGRDYLYHGVRVSIPDDMPFVVKKQLLRGRYEEPERRLVERFLDPALPVIELGGSLGVLSAFVGSKLLPQTPYLIVEANPRLIETCKANASRARGSDDGLSVRHCAIAYGSDTIRFPVADDNIHGNRIGGSAPKEYEVPAKTLSDVVRLLDVGDHPYTLIMDIEGTEYDVFLNDAEALTNCRLAIVETHPGLFEEQGKTLEDFLGLVRSAGLEVLAQDQSTFVFGKGA